MNLRRKLLETVGGADVKKLLAAFDTHKTQLGLVLLMLPDILQAFSGALGSLLPLLTDLEMSGATAVTVKLIGALGVAVGATHKVRKIVVKWISPDKWNGFPK